MQDEERVATPKSAQNANDSAAFMQIKIDSLGNELELCRAMSQKALTGS
ncbi:protein of unknown function [Pararobbsia alpina]